MRSWLGWCLVLAACSSSGNTTADGSCKSGAKWTGGDEESPEMHPGGDCIGCHAKGEGPQLAIAGTVYAANAGSDANDCLGTAGAQVVITDANGKQLTLTANASGNFLLDKKASTIALPYKAKVVYNGKERQMFGEQNVGSCNSCHTASGANGAPGRIRLPE
jgi:hypothetical protein